MLDKTKAAGLAALLDWFRAMGVDEAVGDAAVDWLSRGDRRPGAGFAPPREPPPAASADPAPQRSRAIAPPAPPARRPPPAMPPEPTAPRRLPRRRMPRSWRPAVQRGRPPRSRSSPISSPASTAAG